MDIRHIRYFVEVVRAGSISGAAARLHVTQPPLSLAIARLERELGAQLLRRTSKGVLPTEAGRYLAQTGRLLLNEVDRLERTLRAMGAGEAGSLRVAAGPIVNWELLPPLLGRLAQQAPEAIVELSDPPSGAILAQLQAGEVDLGIVATADEAELRAMYGEDLHVKAVAQMPIVLGLPPRYRDSPPTISLAELVEQTWLVPQATPGFPGMNLLFGAAWRRAGIVPRRVRTIATPQTAIPLVAAGMGISLIPVSRHPRHPDVVVRGTDPAIDPLTVTALWRRSGDGEALLERFVAILDLAK